MLVKQLIKDPFNCKMYYNYIRIYYMQNLFNKEKMSNCHPIPVNIIDRLSSLHTKMGGKKC